MTSRCASRKAGPGGLWRGHEDRRRRRQSEQPWDGKTYGDLLVRGPWIMDAATSRANARWSKPEGVGWFPTGDVATIDADGFMQITDRSKDVIKSGGEWISSIDIENIAMAHPAVAMAPASACRTQVGRAAHRRRGQAPGAGLTREELLAFYEGKTAKWQIPDDVVFVDAIPLGATGKMLKTKLREQLPTTNCPGCGEFAMPVRRTPGGAPVALAIAGYGQSLKRWRICCNLYAVGHVDQWRDKTMKFAIKNNSCLRNALASAGALLPKGRNRQDRLAGSAVWPDGRRGHEPDQELAVHR